MGSLTIQAIAPLGPPVVCGLIGNPEYGRRIGTSASASSGGGGWQTVDRALTAASTEWFDYYPLVMSLTLMLTGGVGLNAQSVEPQIAILEAFELPAPGSQPPQPPQIGIAGPAPHTDKVWICSNLMFAGGETGAIRNAAQQRIQQKLTIELTEYSPSTTTVAGLTPAQQAAAAEQTS